MGEDEAISPATETEGAKPQESEESSEESGEAVEPDVEVVRQGTGGSQPPPQHGIQRRINKLNARVDTANAGTAQAEGALAHKERENELLKLALDQERSKAKATAPPDPADFNGVADPNYAQALREFNQPAIDAAVEKRISALPAPQATKPSGDADLAQKQREHYERVQLMKARDFDETEDKAIAILGNGTANEIIRRSDQSHKVLYFLGKNPDEAEEIKSLIDTDPVAATLRIGRLEAELVARPKGNSEPAPDPDEDLQGGTPSAGQSNKFQKKLDKLREKAMDGGSGKMRAIIDLKKDAEKAGVTVT